MNINDFTSNFTTHPILFLGSGFTRRYAENSLCWEGLLNHLCDIISDKSNNYYYDIESRVDQSLNKAEKMMRIAQTLKERFDDFTMRNNNSHYNEIHSAAYEKYQKLVNTNTPCPKIKLYVSSIFENLKVKDEKNEIPIFLKAIKNVNSIISTNYDLFLEDEIGFNKHIGYDILLNDPYGSLYKIHGCISEPASIVLTEDDYKVFEDRGELIRAQLVSFFIQHPIIFIGYSLTDSHIQNILDVIFKYIPSDSDLIEQVKSRFLLVEYEQDSDNTDIDNFDMVVNGTNVKINRLKTDNYVALYKSLCDMNLSISAMDIAKVKHICHDLVMGNEDSINVIIADDLDELHNCDKILVLASSDQISYRARNVSIDDYFKYYFHLKEIKYKSHITQFSSGDISPKSNEFFPVFSIIEQDNSIAENASIKTCIDNQNNRMKEFIRNVNDRINTQRYARRNEHSSIISIIQDDQISATNKPYVICYGILKGKFLKNDIENYIDSKLKDIGDRGVDTETRRLICHYDYVQYANTEMKTILRRLKD